MCGICGIVQRQGDNKNKIQFMTDTLSHRGPDDEGMYIDSNVGLGHRRLSIIDLSGGHQPLSNEDKTLWIVFNGEIYNYQEIRRSLRDKHQFVTKSDTEVLLHLYEEKRERCVEDLRGQFAFAIWDTKDHSLFMARDHLGQKPLFYTQKADWFGFGSEIKALLAYDPSLREMDPEALHQYLSLRIIAPPRTMFSAIRKLPPGHRMLYKNGQVKIDRYWNLNYEPKFDIKEEDLLDELEQQVFESVRYHMVSDVPVGAFLSGGVDSSLIVAMMSKIANQPVKTFSIGVPYKQYSELPFAQIVADKYQTDHTVETIIPSIIRILPELVWHLDEPSDHLSAPMYYISELARRQVKVVLDGSGGDELFGGYDRYYGNHYVDYYAQLPRGFRKHVVGPLLNWIPDGSWYKSPSHKMKWMHHLSFLEGGKRYVESLSFFYYTEAYQRKLYGDRLIDQMNGFDPKASIQSYFESSNAIDRVDRMLYADSMIRLPDHPVMILDRTTMAHGLEARSPFMDHKLAEFVARIPASLKIRGRTRRYIQMRLAERYLPREVVHRKKQGFSSGLPYMLDKEFRHLFQSTLAGSWLVQDGYLQSPAIQTLLSEHLARKADHGNRLWLLCNAEIWYRMAIQGWSKEDIKQLIDSPIQIG
jgi:asparagine synthase (glutamine-hydrolysing)